MAVPNGEMEPSLNSRARFGKLIEFVKEMDMTYVAGVPYDTINDIDYT